MGSGLDLTDSPRTTISGLSPDGRQIVFVTTRAGGTAALWTLDVQTHRAKALTSGPGGDFRRVVAGWRMDRLLVDRTTGLPFSHGRWEALHFTDIYLIHAQTNGPQLFYGLRYHTEIVKPNDVETFHDQVGYSLWEPATGALIQTLSIPRGQTAMAVGRATADAKPFASKQSVVPRPRDRVQPVSGIRVQD